MNNEEPTDFQQLVYSIYELLANEKQDTIEELKLSTLKESILREIAGLRNEVNQLRTENCKLSEKITNQAREISGLRDQLYQIGINTHRLLEGMTEILVLMRKVSFND
jgi:predicted RNase H-like nuclease (RuvC/YqgF family)